MATLLLWIAGGMAFALAIVWWGVMRDKGKGSADVMERLAGSSERPPAFGRPSASVWDKESKSGEIAPPPDAEPPEGPRPKGQKAP